MPQPEPTTAAAETGCSAAQPCTCHPPPAALGSAGPAGVGMAAGVGGVGGATVPLARLRKGQTGRICECQLAGEDAALLRAMGLCTNARVRLCRVGEPCIVAIECGKRSAAKIVEDATRRRGGGEGTWTGSRIGLARSLAERILIAVDG